MREPVSQNKVDSFRGITLKVDLFLHVYEYVHVYAHIPIHKCVSAYIQAYATHTCTHMIVIPWKSFSLAFGVYAVFIAYSL